MLEFIRGSLKLFQKFKFRSQISSLANLLCFKVIKVIDYDTRINLPNNLLAQLAGIKGFGNTGLIFVRMKSMELYLVD